MGQVKKFDFLVSALARAHVAKIGPDSSDELVEALDWARNAVNEMDPELEAVLRDHFCNHYKFMCLYQFMQDKAEERNEQTRRILDPSRN